MALHVFKNDRIGKIMYNERPLKRSVYTNESHYLLKLDQNDLAGNRIINIIVSQYMGKKDLTYQ
jgi:hypothetical protein